MTGRAGTRPRPRSPALAHGSHWLPTFPELSDASELAILAVLVGVLDVLNLALGVAHRQLFDDERPYWVPAAPGLEEAVIVLRRADQLRRAVYRYRKAIMPPAACSPTEDTDCEVPF